MLVLFFFLFYVNVVPGIIALLLLLGFLCAVFDAILHPRTKLFPLVSEVLDVLRGVILHPRTKLFPLLREECIFMIIYVFVILPITILVYLNLNSCPEWPTIDPGDRVKIIGTEQAMYQALLATPGPSGAFRIIEREGTVLGPKNFGDTPFSYSVMVDGVGRIMVPYGFVKLVKDVNKSNGFGETVPVE